MTRVVRQLGNRWTRLLVPGLLLVATAIPLALLAVPARELAESRAALERARQRSVGADDRRTQQETRALASRLELAEQQLAASNAPDALEFSALVEAFARARELTALDVQREASTAGTPRLVVRGSGALAEWVQLLAELRAHGTSARVEHFELARASGAAGPFELRLTLASAQAEAP